MGMPGHRLGALLLGASLLAGTSCGWKAQERTPRIGYFHGGRTNLIFRAYVDGDFDRAGVKVDLATRNLFNSEYFPIPHSWDGFLEQMDSVSAGRYGKVTGIEILRQIEIGNLDAGMVGESSFLQEIARGTPSVAVAALGHDTLEMPGHCIIFRKGVKVRGPQDMKGLKFCSRRAGPGDEVFLREFLAQEGLDPDKDVQIFDGVSDPLMEKGLVDGTYDGGYFHLMGVVPLVTEGKAYVYRPLNWARADMSVALLVYHKDYLAAHRDEIRKLLETYIRRIDHEYQLPTDQRVQRRKKGLQMAESFLGMNYPQCDIPPVVRVDLLEEMQGLLIKHGFLKKAAPIQDFVDNSLVLEATRNAGFPTDGSYKPKLP